MDAKDFIVGEAELDDEDELSEEGDGEQRKKPKGANGNVDDSSEEDEDDDDEEAAREVRTASSYVDPHTHDSLLTLVHI